VNPDQLLPSASGFQPLFQGEEKEECVRLRQSLFEESWSHIDKRIDVCYRGTRPPRQSWLTLEQHVLRKANQSTLENVTSFVKDSSTRQETDKIPSAFIITGANIASQELLFEQLSETLQQQADAKVVRLRSADASNLKATLKKIIHDVTARATDDGDDLEISLGKDVRVSVWFISNPN
jgi:origin recognition complex subunit 3